MLAGVLRIPSTMTADHVNRAAAGRVPAPIGRPEDSPEHGAPVLEDPLEVRPDEQAVLPAPRIARGRSPASGRPLLEAMFVDPEPVGPRRCSSTNPKGGSHTVISLRHRMGAPRSRSR